METPPPPVSFESAMNLIIRWNAEPAERFISDCDLSEIHQYLQAVDRIQQSACLTPYQSKAQEAIPMAVSRLKQEFLNILLNKVTPPPPRGVTDIAYTTTTTTTTSSQDYATTTTNNEAVYHLRSIAERMNSAGYVSECIQVYKSVRKPFLDTIFKRFQVGKLSASDTRDFLLKELKTKIDHCVHTCNVSSRILFRMEEQLCEQIFEGIERDVCYCQTVEDVLVQLVHYANSLITTTCRLPGCLFKFLDLYEALLGIWPPAKLTGFSRAWEDVVNLRVCDQLVEKVRGTLSYLENAVAHELSPIPEPGGTIHSLTKYVMNYIIHVAKYKNILSMLIVSKPSTSLGALTIPDVEFTQLKGRTPLELHLIFIIAVLRVKLESKSKYYKDASLFHLFLTNNLDYVVRCIKGSIELESMIGDEYMNKLSEKYLRQAMRNYQISTCDKMLHCLRNDEGPRFCMFIFSGVSTATFKRRIKSFNNLFEEARSTQARWVVQDLQLREELCLSIVEQLVPAYKSFLERFKYRVERTKHSNMINYYIKYSPEEIQALISKDFFQVNPVCNTKLLLDPVP